MSFVQQLAVAPRVLVLGGAVATVFGLSTLFTVVQHASTEKNVPRTITPMWQEANEAYRKYQKSDPVFRGLFHR